MEAAYKAMEQPQAKASKILTPIAQAMTDVTGFGLAGHLKPMLQNATGAHLTLANIPLLNGAKTLATQGVRSTIWPANRAAAALANATESPVEALLFDPQTAGGLLAAIPEAQADTALQMLKDTGYQAAIIGQISQGHGEISIS